MVCLSISLVVSQPMTKHTLLVSKVRLLACVMQERQRQGILGIHFRSLDEHMDQQQLQQLLGEVVQRAAVPQRFWESTPLDPHGLSEVLLSRSAVSRRQTEMTMSVVLALDACSLSFAKGRLPFA